MADQTTRTFHVQVYGEGGGVMFACPAAGLSAEAVAHDEAERFVGYPQAARVGVWADDRKSGNAQEAVRRG